MPSCGHSRLLIFLHLLLKLYLKLLVGFLITGLQFDIMSPVNIEMHETEVKTRIKIRESLHREKTGSNGVDDVAYTHRSSR